MKLKYKHILYAAPLVILVKQFKDNCSIEWLLEIDDILSNTSKET